MNSASEEDAALAAMLRAQSPAIPDDGFSTRVLSALPPPRTASARTDRARWPWAAYVGGGLAGTLFAAARAGSWPDFVSSTNQLATALAAVGTALTDPWLVLALVLAAVSLTVALPFIQPRWRFW